MLNSAVLKSVAFWLAAGSTLIGLLLSQHVVVDGSTAATILGWIMTLLGMGGVGHQVGSISAASRA